MVTFFVIGGIGIAMLLVSLLVGDHVHGIFDALGGGDWFTGASLAGFLGALGFGGALILSLTDSLPFAVLGGVILGVMLGATVGYGVLQLRKTQEGGAPQTSSLLDRVGTVISDIPADGYGEIRLTQGGHMQKINARASMPIKAGTQVTVTDVLSATAVKVIPTYQ